MLKKKEVSLGKIASCLVSFEDSKDEILLVNSDLPEKDKYKIIEESEKGNIEKGEVKYLDGKYVFLMI